MSKKLYVAVFALLLAVALPLSAGTVAKSVHKATNDKNYNKGTTLVFTNLQGPNHHKYGPESGYYIDSTNFNDQTLGVSFAPSSSVGFADAYMPLGVYTANGGQGGGTADVTLQSDAGGIPSGTILDGPLTASNGIGLFPGNFVEYDCVTCPTLSAGTTYWIVASQDNANVQLTWDFSRGLTDLNSGFAFTAFNTGNVWTVIGSGFQRPAWEVDGF